MIEQKRMAARILKCGTSRIWVDPKKVAEVNEAITNADVRRLINSGIIIKKQKLGLSSGRKNKIKKQKDKGRRKGHGSRKGTSGARFSRKRDWIKRIRGIRDVLKQLRDEKKIDNRKYKILYKKAKGGFFRNKAHLKNYLEREGIEKVKDDVEKKT